MVSVDVLSHLRRHAGFAESAGLSIAVVTSDPPPRSECVDLAVADFVAVLARLNHDLNGPAPSDALIGTTDVPRDVAYAVSEVIRLLRGRDDRASEAAWTVETAWLAVLAGDVDDLRQHLLEEKRVSGWLHPGGLGA